MAAEPKSRFQTTFVVGDRGYNAHVRLGKISMEMTAERTTSPRPDPGREDATGFAFAPIHKRALGVALGVVSGLGIFLVTVFHVVLQPGDPLSLHLLAQYFYGYDVSWRGALVGLFWGFVTGFVFGWFAAFVRNVVVATTIFVLRTKAELAQTKDFLDHI